ncbi:hypothetical protein GW17_00053913, partial [Ensete ventricosum]
GTRAVGWGPYAIRYVDSGQDGVRRRGASGGERTVAPLFASITGGISALRPPSDGCQRRGPPLMPSHWPRPEAARQPSDRRLDGPDRVGRMAIPVIEPRNKLAQIEPGSSSNFD